MQRQSSPSYDLLLLTIVEECRINEPNEQLEDDINIFGVGTFVEESSQALIIEELSLFRRLHVPQLHVKIPLLGDTLMRGHFSNVAFFGHKLKHDKCLILLRCYHLSLLLIS